MGSYYSKMKGSVPARRRFNLGDRVACNVGENWSEGVVPPVANKHKKSNHMGVSFRNVTREAMAVLVNYAWPGNVRELENVIERTLVLSDGEVIDTVDLPFDDAISSHIGGRSDAGLSDLGLNNRLDALERELICQALEKSEGVKTKAAALLGVKTSALYYKLDKYGLT